MQEIEKVKARRAEREREKERLEEERARMFREKELETYEEWKEKENTFHLSQAMLRSKIRIEKGRE